MHNFLIENYALLFITAIVLLILVILEMLWFTGRCKKRIRIEYKKRYFGGEDIELIYADDGTRGPLTYQYRNIVLSGKPDQVVRDKKTDEVSVIDLKSGTAPVSMSTSHAFQLAAYFLLVEESLGYMPSKGIIKYLEDRKELSIDNTEDLRKELFAKMVSLAQSKKNIENGKMSSLIRNHNDISRCQACEYKGICTQRII